MMKRQSLIALGVAVVLAAFAVYIANAYIGGAQHQAQLSGTTKVAVASVPLAYGVDITPDKVRFVDYPNSSLPAGVFTDPKMLLDPAQKRVALMPISVNEPILADKISAAGQGASIAALLPAGMRAAAVRINDVSGVAGFVQPNDSVDVLITRTLANGNGAGQQVTDVLLQNVRVIAIDQTAKNADGTPKVGRTATLQVSPVDAQKLALAQQVGSLSFVLRKAGEDNNPVVETVSLNDLRYNMYGGARYPAPAVAGGYAGALSGAFNRASETIASANSRPRRSAPRSTPPSQSAVRPAKPAGTSIEVYRGTTSNHYEVGGYGS